MEAHAQMSSRSDSPLSQWAVLGGTPVIVLMMYLPIIIPEQLRRCTVLAPRLSKSPYFSNMCTSKQNRSLHKSLRFLFSQNSTRGEREHLPGYPGGKNTPCATSPSKLVTAFPQRFTASAGVALLNPATYRKLLNPRSSECHVYGCRCTK